MHGAYHVVAQGNPTELFSNWFLTRIFLRFNLAPTNKF